MAEQSMGGGGAGGPIARFIDSDLFYSFRHSPVTIVAAVVTVIMMGAAAFAPLVAPHRPFDLATLDLLNAFLPPAWLPGGDPNFLLGTDDQGRDVL